MALKEPITTAEYAYTVLLHQEPGGGYTVTCPALPGLVSYGESLEEARHMAAEAIEAYLESLQKDGQLLPASDASEPHPVAERVSVKLQLGMSGLPALSGKERGLVLAYTKSTIL